MRFIRILKSKSNGESKELTASELSKVDICWVKAAQNLLMKEEKFKMWINQFGLFHDSDGVWRCEAE